MARGRPVAEPDLELDPPGLVAEFAAIREVRRRCRRRPVRAWWCRLRGRPEWACFDPRPCLGHDGRQCA